MGTFLTVSNLGPLLDFAEMWIMMSGLWSLVSFSTALTTSIHSWCWPSLLLFTLYTLRCPSRHHKEIASYLASDLSSTLVSSGSLENLENIQRDHQCLLELCKPWGSISGPFFLDTSPLIFCFLMKAYVDIRTFILSVSFFLTFCLICSYYSSGAENLVYCSLAHDTLSSLAHVKHFCLHFFVCWFFSIFPYSYSY